jgi:hypothetical protein
MFHRETLPFSSPATLSWTDNWPESTIRGMEASRAKEETNRWKQLLHSIIVRIESHYDTSKSGSYVQI